MPWQREAEPISVTKKIRVPECTKHTHAIQLLTTGVASIDWIAEQKGHTNDNMIRQHYGTWINEDGPDVVGILQLALKLDPATARH
jgi:integrase